MSAKKSLIIGMSAIALGLALTSIGIAQAASQQNQGNPNSNLITALAQKFNLNTTDVQKVFDEQRDLMQAQRQKENSERLATRLEKAVTDNNLTQAQADLITAKYKEIQTFHDSLKDKSATDRDAAIKEQQTALNKWATDNNIPQQYMPMGFGDGRGGPHGPNDGRMGPDGDRPFDKDTTSTDSSPSTNN